MLVLCALALAATSCRTPVAPAFETSTGGWITVAGQAVWTPGAETEAVTGDFLLASHPDGRLLIDFSKGSLSVAVVRCTPTAWQLEIPARGWSFSGRGLPPPRASWLVLARDRAVQPPPPHWAFEASRPGVLRLWSSETGESLELHGWVP